MNPLTAHYLNRLSDLLFILARLANSPDLGGTGDVLWQPGQRQLIEFAGRPGPALSASLAAGRRGADRRRGARVGWTARLAKPVQALRESGTSPDRDPRTVVRTGPRTPAFTGHRGDWPRITAPTGPGPAGVAVLVWSVTPLLRVDLASGTVNRPALCVGPVDGVFPVEVPWARVVNVADHGDRRVLRVDPTDRLRGAGRRRDGQRWHDSLAAGGAYAVAGRDGTLLVVFSNVLRPDGHPLRRGRTHDPRSTPCRTSTCCWARPNRDSWCAHRSVGRLSPSGVDCSSSNPETLQVLRDLGAESDAHPALEGDRLAWFVDARCERACVLRIADLERGGDPRTSLSRARGNCRRSARPSPRTARPSHCRTQTSAAGPAE